LIVSKHDPSAAGGKYEQAAVPTGVDAGYVYSEGERVCHIPTAYHGEVRFFGSDKQPKPYVVLSDDSHPGRIRVMMEKEWGLVSPNLLISVTGGAQGFKSPNAKLEETFRCAMMRAAMRTNAWIITGGTDSGVMEMVGKAVDDYGSNVPGKNTENSELIYCCGAIVFLSSLPALSPPRPLNPSPHSPPHSSTSRPVIGIGAWGTVTHKDCLKTNTKQEPAM
jgi:hypothetical protein